MTLIMPALASEWDDVEAKVSKKKPGCVGGLVRS